MAVTLNNLAVLYKSEGRLDEAAALYHRALSIFERTLGPEHPKAITCRKNSAGLRTAASQASRP